MNKPITYEQNGALVRGLGIATITNVGALTGSLGPVAGATGATGGTGSTGSTGSSFTTTQGLAIAGGALVVGIGLAYVLAKKKGKRR